MILKNRFVCMDCLAFSRCSIVLFSDKILAKFSFIVELSFVKSFFFAILRTFDRDWVNTDFLWCHLCIYKKRNNVFVFWDRRIVRWLKV